MEKLWSWGADQEEKGGKKENSKNEEAKSS